MNGCLRAVGKHNLRERNFAFLFPVYTEVSAPQREQGGQKTTPRSQFSPWIAGNLNSSHQAPVFLAAKPSCWAPSQAILQVDMALRTNVSGVVYFHGLLTTFP